MQSNIEDWKNKILAYALDNAITHQSKAVPQAVLSHLFREGLQKENVKDILPLLQATVKRVNLLDLDTQRKEFDSLGIKLRKFEQSSEKLSDLPNITQQMVFRLAPFPSGDLHLGNAKTYLLNALYAEKYNGKIILVLDDTIGSKEKSIVKEAYALIPESFDWLGIKYTKPIIYKSSRLKVYYEYAEKIISMGKAYVCNCTHDEMRKNRAEGKICSCRNHSIEEQKTKWKQMFHQKEGESTLRIKTDMRHKNPAFRDRVLFRISERKHPKVGNKFKVWPMLEFSWAIDDHLLGITHIIRGNDLVIETMMERFIWDIFGWPDKTIIHSGFISIEGVKLAKSKAQKEIKSGEYFGWDDPRTWSIHSLKRRGFKPEALRQFIQEIGLNQTDITIPLEKLYAINRRMIDKKAMRFSFVGEPIQLNFKVMPDIKKIKVKIHPESTRTRIIQLGKEIYISKEDHLKNQDQEARLLHLFNVKFGKEDLVTSLENKNIPKINWVSFYKKARILLEDGTWLSGYAEASVKKLKLGDVIQFERFCFARLDRKIKAGKEEIYEFWFIHR